MSTYKLDIFGLDDIKQYINPDRISKALSIGVGEAVLQLHNTLRTSVFQRYERPNDLNKALKRSSSIAETGKNFIRNGLVYQDSTRNAASFPYTPTIQSRLKPLNLNPEWGNLTVTKPRKGLVHSVSIVRGRQVKVHGKYKQGGFAVRKGAKVVMLQRTGKARYPTASVQALNLVDMALIRLKNDPKVIASLDNLENVIIDKFIP